MDIWESVYPGVSSPNYHRKSERITENGKNFVTEVVFDNLGNSSVIVITGTSSDYLLVYKTTFIKPSNTDSNINGKYGGAISCKGINCVQFYVCSDGAYCSSRGSQSYIDLSSSQNCKCQVFGCSFTNVPGYDTVLHHKYGIQDIKNTNFSYCTCRDEVETFLTNAVGTATQNFTMNCNISSTTIYPLFCYWYMSIDIFQSVFLRNTNKPGNYGLFYVPDSTMNIKECIFKDNSGQTLFDTRSNQKYTVSNCLFENPAWPNNGASYGPSTNYLSFKLSFLSTQLCNADNSLVNFIFGKNNPHEQTFVENYYIRLLLCDFEFAILPSTVL